jgi:hypothetical protein
MYRSAQSDARNLFRRGWARELGLGFVEINKITAKLI